MNDKFVNSFKNCAYLNADSMACLAMNNDEKKTQLMNNDERCEPTNKKIF